MQPNKPNPHSPEYQKAFQTFLRSGISPNLLLKAAPEKHATEQYIWRTQNDGNVRPEHAANEGKIFSWDDPPPTGHPGEARGCRCWAEDYAGGERSFNLTQIVTSPINDSWWRWTWADFFYHYKFGNGRMVTLQDIGHMSEIIELSKFLIFPNVEAQIMDKAEAIKTGWIYDTFSNSYSFRSVSKAHGDSKVSGEFQGSITDEGGYLEINATVDYFFHDEFTDIFSERQRSTGTSSIEDATLQELENTEYGTPYIISGMWSTEVSGHIALP